MPNLKNAKKKVNSNIKKTKVNNEYAASMKTSIKNVERAVAGKDKKLAEEKLKVHGIIKKVARKNKYYLTTNGRNLISSILLFTDKELLN